VLTGFSRMAFIKVIVSESSREEVARFPINLF
jgi:hypothetical protein